MKYSCNDKKWVLPRKRMLPKISKQGHNPDFIEEAKANGINPHKCLLHIMEYLPGKNFRRNVEYLEAYLP